MSEWQCGFCGTVYPPSQMKCHECGVSQFDLPRLGE